MPSYILIEIESALSHQDLLSSRFSLAWPVPHPPSMASALFLASVCGLVRNEAQQHEAYARFGNVFSTAHALRLPSGLSISASSERKMAAGRPKTRVAASDLKDVR